MSMFYQGDAKMKRRTTAEATGPVARPSVTVQTPDCSDSRLAGSEAEIVAVERWENEGGMVMGP
jgi:hypothetical protein